MSKNKILAVGMFLGGVALCAACPALTPAIKVATIAGAVQTWNRPDD